MKRHPKTEYLKRHKIPLIVLSFAIIALIFAILFWNIMEQGKAQQALFTKEQEQLTDMDTYLHEIAKTVDTNREQLAEAILSQTEAAQTLAELSESLMLLDNNLAGVEARIEKQKEIQTSQNERITTAFALLSNNQQDIREQIDTVLLDLQEKMDNNFLTSIEKLEIVQKEIKNIFKSTSEKLENMREENEANFKSASEKLENIREENETNFNSTSEKLENIQEKNANNFILTFEKLEKLQGDFDQIYADTEAYYENLTKAIILLQEESGTQHGELVENLLTVKEDISSLLNNRFANLELSLDEDVAALMACLDTLHTQIADAELSIFTLLTLMETNNSERQDEINAAFASLNVAMEQIQTDYSNAHFQIQQLIERLQETSDNNHAETLSILAVMENNMSESSMENFNHISNSLQTMGDSLSASMNNMQNEFSQNLDNFNTEISGNLSQYTNSMTEQLNRISTGITNQYQSLNSTIANQYQNLSTTINSYDNSQQEALNNMLDILNQKLQQVFQRVSDGKKLLASALLTKSVTVKEDATFNEIYNAILNIPQKTVIGVQEIPGTVTYDYHYHLNGSGNATHTENEAAGGGCYTIPVYHVHTGDSRNGGGCYTVPITHSHVDSCYTVTKTVRRVTAKWFTGQGTGHACCQSGYGQNWARYTYVDEIYINNELISSIAGDDDLGYCCGICFERRAAEKAYTSTTTDITCGYSEGVNSYEAGCGKNNNTIESYMPGCGFVDGQIIAAHIVYSPEAFTTANPAMLHIEPKKPEGIATVSGNVPSDKNAETP